MLLVELFLLDSRKSLKILECAFTEVNLWDVKNKKPVNIRDCFTTCFKYFLLALPQLVLQVPKG